MPSFLVHKRRFDYRRRTRRCSETASASRFGLRLGRSIWNSSEGIAELLGTSGQVCEFTLSALPIILGRCLFTVGLVCLEEVIHCSGYFVCCRHNRLLRPKPGTHRSIVGAKR